MLAIAHHFCLKWACTHTHTGKRGCILVEPACQRINGVYGETRCQWWWSSEDTQNTQTTNLTWPQLTRPWQQTQTGRATRAITIKLGNHWHSQTNHSVFYFMLLHPIPSFLHLLYFLLLFQASPGAYIVSSDPCLSENINSFNRAFLDHNQLTSLTYCFHLSLKIRHNINIYPSSKSSIIKLLLLLPSFFFYYTYHLYLIAFDYIFLLITNQHGDEKCTGTYRSCIHTLSLGIAVL